MAVSACNLLRQKLSRGFFVICFEHNYCKGSVLWGVTLCSLVDSISLAEVHSDSIFILCPTDKGSRLFRNNGTYEPDYIASQQTSYRVF
jgi:hypothetical protein